MSAFSKIPLQRQIPRLVTKGKGLLDAIYPPRCLNCQELTAGGASLCARCWSDTRFLTGAFCDHCAMPLPGPFETGLVCDACLSAPPDWDHGRAAILYEGAGRRLVLSLKHGDRLDMARPLAVWMQRAGGDVLERADIIVPVPLHRTRFFMRQYNQSALLAKHLGKLSKRRVIPDLLVRNRPTKLQNGMSRSQRQENQSGAFAVHPRHSPAGKRILLLDDVMTTGATLSACARVLRRHGAQQIDALVLARVARDI